MWALSSLSSWSAWSWIFYLPIKYLILNPRNWCQKQRLDLAELGHAVWDVGHRNCTSQSSKVIFDIYYRNQGLSHACPWDSDLIPLTLENLNSGNSDYQSHVSIDTGLSEGTAREEFSEGHCTHRSLAETNYLASSAWERAMASHCKEVESRRYHHTLFLLPSTKTDSSSTIN